MRIFSNAYELMSESMRDCWEMGTLVKPKSYQNKRIEGNEDFQTKEIICYQYCLTSLDKEKYLYLFDIRSKEWVREELQERVFNPLSIGIPGNVNPGEAYKLRADVWQQFLVNGHFDYTYNERLRYGWTDSKGINHSDRVWDVLSKVISELRDNPDTRQAVLPIFHATDVKHIGGEQRVPCSMYYDLLIRDSTKGGKQLNICYHQRSSDIVTHFGNDVALAFKLMEYVAKELEIRPGYLYHTIDSLHCYKKDWNKLKICIDELIKQ